MFKFLKLHIGLIKYINAELKKTKTVKEIIKLFYDVIKAYLKHLLLGYKHLLNYFDTEFVKQRNKYYKFQKLRTDLQRALKILRYVDDKMEKQGVSRQRRRQFWRDFFRDGQMRKDVFEDLMKEINQIKG